MKKLEQIKDFGGIDADNDALLISCFQNHEAFRAVNEFEKFIVLGRKGTGKTAIFKKILQRKEHDVFSFGHTFSDYPWNYHDKQVKLGVPDFDKYTHSWKYLIYLTISKILLNQDSSLPHDDTCLTYLSRLESFVLDTYGTRDPDVTQVFTPGKEIKLKPNFKLAVPGFEATLAAERVAMANLPVIIQEINYNLAEYVTYSLNPQNKYYVLFDQLDLGFDPENPDYSNRLIGLLRAARDINLAAKDMNRKLNVIVFLRDDIYNKLRFEDKNKLTTGFSTYIEWDIRGNHTLKHLMELRFKELLAEGEEDVKWEDIFDETQLMTGKQTKYNYITDRTFLRPRDMIQFCNEIVEQHKNNPDKSEKVDNNEVYTAKNEYSKYLLRELDDEVYKHLPNYEIIFEAIKSLEYYKFNRDDFSKALEYKGVPIHHGQDVVNYLKTLFEFSIVGYYKAGGMGFGGSEYVFKYKDQSAKLDENSAYFMIHPGLIETFSLKRSTRPRQSGKIDVEGETQA